MSRHRPLQSPAPPGPTPAARLRGSSPAGPGSWRSSGASVALSLVLVPTLFACDSFVPQLGQQLQPRCVEADGDPSTEVSFGADIVAGIFRGSGACLPCHDPLGPDPQGYLQGGLDLTRHAGVLAGGVNSGAATAIPGKPCGSWLWLKVTSSPPSGSQMPLAAAALSAQQLQLIHDWIAEGARDN